MTIRKLSVAEVRDLLRVNPEALEALDTWVESKLTLPNSQQFMVDGALVERLTYLLSQVDKSEVVENEEDDYVEGA